MCHVQQAEEGQVCHYSSSRKARCVITVGRGRPGVACTVGRGRPGVSLQ